MNPIYSDIETLIAKQFAGEISPDEAMVVAHWLEDSAQNRAYYDQLHRLWEMAPQARPAAAFQFNTEAALTKVKTQVKTAPVASASPWKVYLPYAAAAAIALLVVAAWWLHGTPNAPVTQLATLPTEIQTHQLPDGSTVTLNRNSGLSTQSGFNQKERRIALRGEAYFEVKPDREKPFVVSVEELSVTVLGTAFNVDNNTDPNRVLISVTHGKVAVSAREQTIYLTADQQAVYDKTSGTLTLLAPEQQDPNAVAYKNKVFQFNATPLVDVVAALNKAYGVQIVLKGQQLHTCPLTARYNNLGLDRVLELIAASFSIKAEKQADGTYALSGNGCEE
jgi:transmembrane sensor